jgi:hypothetical protein
MCCDGTLFTNVILQPGEKEHLPAEMEKFYIKTEASESFKQPCSYFHGKCSIYDQVKPNVCSAFRCALLMDFSKDVVSQQEAFLIVENAIQQRDEIVHLAQLVFDTTEKLYFKNILEQISTSEETQNAVIIEHPSFNLLKIKAIIFEALLVRHFKSKESFDKMIVNESYKS